MYQGWHARCGDGVEDASGAADVDPPHLFRVVGRLQKPGQVDDHVRAGERRDEVVLGDVEGVPLRALVALGR